MAIKLTCPGCQDTVEAQDAERGQKVKCGTCWSDVEVPLAPATPVKAAPLPTAKPIPAAPTTPVVAQANSSGPKKATPLAAPIATPVAKPVVATALPTASGAKAGKPVEAKTKSDDQSDAKTSRFKERGRDRDEEDDDDDRPRKEAKKGGAGVVIAFVCVGAVLLLGVAGAVAVLVMNSKDQTASATSAATSSPAHGTTPPVDIPLPPPRNPGDFNPGRPIDQPQPKPPALRPKGWTEYRVKDFACDMPGLVAKAPAKFDYATKPVSGTSHTAGEQNTGVKVTVLELTLPFGTSATSSAFVAAAFGLPEGDLKKDPNGRLVSGNPGVEYTAAIADGTENVILAIGVGTRNAFLFRFQWKPNTPEAVTKRDNFLASVTVLLEGEAPVVRDPFGRPNANVPKPITAPWKPLENTDGFAVSVPPGVKKERHLLELDRNGVKVNGKKWYVDDEDVAYHIFYHDLPPDYLELDLKKIAGPLVHGVFPHEVQDQEQAKVDGKPAVRWNVRHFHGGITHGVSTQLGYRVFTLFCTSKQGIFGKADATVTDREERFLNSIKLTFDPKTHNPYADEPDWVPMDKTVGFTALVPKRSSPATEFNPFFFPEAPAGKEWKAEVDGIVYQVFVVDFSPNPKRNQLTNKSPADLIKWFGDREKLVSGPDKVKLGNLNAEGYVLKPHTGESHVRLVLGGNVVFVAKTSRSGDWNSKCGDKEYADKSAKFFAGFRLGDQVAVLPKDGTGIDPAAAATGDFMKVPDARVQPFWAAVFLPQKKEFMTFGVKDSTARPVRGVLRRYSFPDVKLKATYETPSPINRAAVDEANGRLFVATVRDAADAATSEKDDLRATGDIQQYDLNKLTDGSLGDHEQVKPVNVLNAAASAFKVSGLEVSADGSAVFVSGVTVSGKAPRQTFRGKLLKWETAASKFAPDINLDAPVWAMDVSADGKTVVALERNPDPTRPGGNVVLVDAVGWKRTATVPLTGTPHDIAYRNVRTAVLTTPGPGQGRLLFGQADGELGETDTGGEVAYVRFTPGGTKLLVSAGGQSTGLTLYELDGAKPPKVKKVAYAGELGGLFVISPDGKWTVTNSGVVLDLEKSRAK